MRCLGTPCIYINSLNAGTLKDQEKYGLIESLRNDENLIEIAKNKLADLKHLKQSQRSKAKMLEKD